MRLLLVSANRERSPYPVFPLGLAYLAGPLREAGREVAAIDLCFVDDPAASVREALDRISPEALIISIRNIDNVTFPGTRSYLEGVREVVSCCTGRAPVIVGGSGF